MILSVDPGVHLAGVALWHGKTGQLVRAGLVREASSIPSLARAVGFWAEDVSVTEIAIEIPQVYVRSRSKGNPNDLIQLALAAGMVAGRINPSTTEFYYPATWKGQVPKEIMQERIRRALSLPEQGLVERCSCPASLLHNVWDAVGIGLYHLRHKRGLDGKLSTTRTPPHA